MPANVLIVEELENVRSYRLSMRPFRAAGISNRRGAGT